MALYGSVITLARYKIKQKCLLAVNPKIIRLIYMLDFR